MNGDLPKVIRIEGPRMVNGGPGRVVVTSDNIPRPESWRAGAWRPGGFDSADWFAASPIPPERLQELTLQPGFLTGDHFKIVRTEMPRMSGGRLIRVARSAAGVARVEAWLDGAWIPGKASFSEWYAATAVAPQELARLGVPVSSPSSNPHPTHQPSP